MIVLLAAAVGFAAGLWLLLSTVWPATPPLDAALQQLHATGRPTTGSVPGTAPDRAATVRAGRWWLRHLSGAGVSDDTTLRDLAVLHRPLEVHAGVTVFAAMSGAAVGPFIYGTALAAGTLLPVIVPLWMSVVGIAGGALVPRLVLRAEAAKARRDFRHALGAYLDILVLLLAANEGPEGAMEAAARAGTGPAFMDLRRATIEARLSASTIWAQLDELGATIGVDELREVAAAGNLAGEQGAAVRKSLIAKARSLRATSLSAAESDARRRSNAMFAPIVVMGIGFLLFLIYPLITNLEIGT
jgi:tight adherence protein C